MRVLVADDYVVKPFPLAVLYQKCQIIFSRYVGADRKNRLTISEISLDFDSMKVSVRNEEIQTTQKDFALLAYLMKNKGIVLDREAILIKVWGYDYDGDTRVVDTHIKRLRKKLKDKGNCIVTKVNVGYMFEEK